MDTLALTKSWDQDKALSLNIEKRRARSAKWDTELFRLENIRRSKKGLKPYADIETWKQAEEPEEATIAESDPLLQEAGYILTDQILLQARLKKTAQPQLAQINKK